MRVPRSLAAVAVAVAFATALAGGQARPPQGGSGLIVGQVVDARGEKPIAGAIVSIAGSAGAGRPRVLTGSSGRFVFRDLPRGHYIITATKSGYAPGAYGRRRPGGPAYAIALADDQRLGDVTVTMWKHAAIAGTIVDETGERVVRAQLRAWRRTVVAGFPRLAMTATALTDDHGEYRLFGLLPGSYVVATSAHHSIVPSNVDTTEWGAAALRTRDLAYYLGGGIVTPPPPDEGFSLYPASYYAGSGDATNAMPIAVGSGDERSSVDIQVHPVATVRVSGVLLSPVGPAAFQTVRLLAADEQYLEPQDDAPTIVSNAAGAFVFPAVPPGRYTLRATVTALSATHAPGEFYWASTPLQVGSTDLDRVVVTLVPELHVSGRLEFEGTSPRPSPAQIARIPLLVESADGDGELGPFPVVRATPEGDFKSGGLTGGRYVVRVTDSPTGWMFKAASYGGRDISSAPVDLGGFDASGVVVTFTDRWSGLNGIVQTRARNPDPDALVVIFPVDRQLWTGYGTASRRVRSVRSGRYGEYGFTSVPPGDYYVAALPDDKADGWEAPESLEQVIRDATRVTLRDGETRRQDVRTREMR